MTPIQLHTAGATVQHHGPFAEVQVPVCHEPLSADVRETWVRPLYFGLRKPHVKQFLETHLPLVSDDLIYQLLSHFDWRSRITVAYLAALGNRTNFTQHIGRLLVRSDVCFAGSGYCIALAKFNNPEGLSFLMQYLDYYLQRVDLWFDQGNAMAALSYLDNKNGTQNVRLHIDAWNKFIENKRDWNLERSVAFFAESMHLLNELNVDSNG